jgi:hypothetical protein
MTMGIFYGKYTYTQSIMSGNTTPEITLSADVISMCKHMAKLFHNDQVLLTEDDLNQEALIACYQALSANKSYDINGLRSLVRFRLSTFGDVKRPTTQFRPTDDGEEDDVDMDDTAY